MKKIILFTAFVLTGFLPFNLLGQSLEMFYTEPSQYPVMTTGFKLYDAQDNEIRNSPTSKPITKAEILIEELVDGVRVPREVLEDPLCPPATETTFSAVLVCDISNSMLEELPSKQKKIDALKDVLKEWAKQFDPKRTETAITAFCSEAMPKNIVKYPNDPIRPFTSDRDSLIMAIDSLPDICSGTNYNAAFLHMKSQTFITKFSGMYWCQPTIAKYKPVIIFLTDGGHNPQTAGALYGGQFNRDAVQLLAIERNVTIYVIQFGTEDLTPENQLHLEALATYGKPSTDATPNLWTKVNSAQELKDIYSQILVEAGTLGAPPPCYVKWKGACEGGSATFTFRNHNNLVGVSDYVVGAGKKPHLKITQNNLLFSNVAPGGSGASMTLTLKSENNDTEITGIDFLNDDGLRPAFTVTDWGPKAPLPFPIEKDSTYKIVVNYNPPDSTCLSDTVIFTGSACSGNEIYVKGEMLPIVENLDMGNVNIGGDKTITFNKVFCNKTCQNINVTATPKFTGTGASNFSVIKPTGATLLQPGDCLEMEIKFTPTEPAGAKTAKLEIKTDISGQPFRGNITGNAVGGKTIVHNDPGCDSAGCTATSVDYIITLENAGVETINGITATVIDPNSNFTFKSIGKNTLAGGEQTTVTVVFDPTNPANQNADYTASLRVTSDAENSPYDIPLTGPMRNIDFTLSAAVDFQEVCVGTPETKQVTLTNTGNVPLNVIASSTTPFQPAQSAYNSVPVGGNVTIDVECNPLSDGAFNSNLTITNAECNLIKTVALNAMGVYPSISFDKQVNLNATIGGSDEIDIVVKNESDSPVTIDSIVPCDKVRFAISNLNPAPLPKTIQPGSPISFKVTYTPQTGDTTPTSSCIRFYGSTCNFDTSVAITGNPDAAIVKIGIDEYSGYAGNDLDNVVLYLKEGFKFDESGTTKISCKIQYDGDLLKANGFTESNGTGTMKIITLTDKPVNAVNTQQAVETLSFTIQSGSGKTSTPFEILEPTGNGGNGFIVKNGLFNLSQSGGTLSIDTATAIVGEDVKIKVRLVGANLPGDNTDKITLKVEFDGTLLEPTNKSPLLETKLYDPKKYIRTVTYKLPIAPQSGDLLAELSFHTMIGMSDTTTITIQEVTARGGVLTGVNGFFRATGLCKTGDGTTRLFDPLRTPKILSMNPNPTDGMINIEYETSEKGYTKMWVSDMLGNHVYELFNGVPNPGTADVNLDGTKLPNGVYFIIMQTPTQIVREKIYIMR